MTPPAPGRLSTITCWPQRSLSFWATKRAEKSDVLPGDPVMRRTGRVGYSCAAAIADDSAMQTATQPPAKDEGRMKDGVDRAWKARFEARSAGAKIRPAF